MSVKVKTETVTFSDGSTLTVSESNWDIAMRLQRMEQEAQASPLEDADKQLFRLAFYPKLAACASGDVPSEEEARAMPEDDLDLWYEAVRRMNPKWFAAIDKANAEDVKKKGSGGG